MKCALDGSIFWKTNLASDVSLVDGVQIVDGNIILDLFLSEQPFQHYIVLDSNTGEVLQDATEITSQSNY